jgi:ankyrin repeat protein
MSHLSLPSLRGNKNASTAARKSQQPTNRKPAAQKITLLARVMHYYGVTNGAPSDAVAGPMNHVLEFVGPQQVCAMAAACRTLGAMVEHDATVALPQATAEYREVIGHACSAHTQATPFMSQRRLLHQTRLRVCCTESQRRWSLERSEVQRGRTQSATVAARDGDMQRLKRVVRLGANLFDTNYAGQSAMQAAWNSEDARMIRWLHMAGISLPHLVPPPVKGTIAAPSAGCGDVESCVYLDLWCALSIDSVLAARCLLEEGGRANSNGFICPHSSKDATVNREWLMKRNASKTSETARPPLHFARSKEMVLLLLSFGADVNAVDFMGNTAVHSMCTNRSVFGLVPADVLRLLASFGADFSIPNNLGQTCLHAAAASGNIEVVRLLLSMQSVVIDARDVAGRTPLLSALSDDPSAMVGAVFSECSKGSKDHSDTNNRTGTAEVVQALVESGAQVNASDKRGATPLGGARRLGLAKSVVLLSAHGAMEGETHSRIEWEVEGRQPSRPGNAGHDPPRCTLPKLERA